MVRYNGLVWSNIAVTLLLPSYIYDPCTSQRSPGIMLVTLFKNRSVVNERFSSSQDSQHSWYSSLQQPNKLVEIMKRYLEWFCCHEHGSILIIKIIFVDNNFSLELNFCILQQYTCFATHRFPLKNS